MAEPTELVEAIDKQTFENLVRDAIDAAFRKNLTPEEQDEEELEDVATGLAKKRTDRRVEKETVEGRKDISMELIQGALTVLAPLSMLLGQESQLGEAGLTQPTTQRLPGRLPTQPFFQPLGVGTANRSRVFESALINQLSLGR